MNRYVVSYDLIIPGVIEVEARSLDEAVDKTFSMDAQELMKWVNNESAVLVETSVNVEDEDEEKNE